MYEIMMDNFMDLNLWKNYNPTYYYIQDNDYLCAKGMGKGMQSAEYINSNLLTPGVNYYFYWNMIYYSGQGGGIIDAGGTTYPFMSDGIGFHGAYVTCGGDTYLKLNTGGAPGSIVWKLDFLYVYLFPSGKKVLINNSPITSLVNKGL